MDVRTREQAQAEERRPRRAGKRPVPSEALVRGALIVAIASTALHYTDNYLNIEDYPQPHWINHAVVPIAWVLLTAVGIAGYAFYRRGRLVPAALCLVLYSYTGLSSLAHYLYGPMSEFTPKMHAGIMFDGLTGAAVLVVAVWMLIAGHVRSRAAS